MDVTLELGSMEDFLDKPAARTEWDRKLAQADGFVAQVWQGSKLWLVGQA
jgi:hypothetical protein